MTLPTDATSLPPEAVRSRLQGARRLLERVMRRGVRLAGESRTTVAILRAQQESTLDGILVVDHAGRILSYNRRFLEIWGIPAAIAAHADDNTLLGYAAEAVAEWGSFIELVNYLYEHPFEVRMDDAVPLKDGRILSRATTPIVVGSTIRGRAWYFRDITETVKAERLQAALFRIARLSHEAESIDALYAAVHGVIGELMNAPNFYVATFDPATSQLAFPYFVDELDPLPPEGGVRGLTAHMMRTGEPLLATPDVFQRLVRSGEVEAVGAACIDWLGAPLTSGGSTWGAIVAQSYTEATRYTERDKEILVFVAQHVASAVEQKRKDDALRESERRYRQMFENTRAVQLLIDPANGTFVDANMAACDYYGYTREEMRGMRVRDINVRGEAHIPQDMSLAVSQEVSLFYFRHMKANGEVRDVEIHSGPVEVGGRKLLYSIVNDITERRRAEQALQQSEEKYRVIFDYAPVGIYQSTRDGSIVTANLTLARMLGYDSADELLTRNLQRDVYYDPDQREEIILRFEPFNYANHIELQWKRKDGTPIWVELNAHAVKSGAPGIVYFEGFVYDITERRHAAESVAAANAQRKEVLDAATRVSIIATDAEGTITVFNTGAERMLGYAASEMIGLRSMTVVVGGQAALHDAVGEHEWTYVRTDGDLVIVSVSVTALRDESTSPTGYLHVATDITARKKAEEMLRSQSAAVTASMDGIGILDERLDFSYANDSLARLYGYPSPKAMIGRNLCDLYEPHEQVRFITSIVPTVIQRGRWRGEASGLRMDGVNFPQEISLTSISGDGSMVCVVRDITERTYAEEQIKHLAYHDALTNLPNRLLFKDRLTVALSHAHREDSGLAVLFLDLDRFKVINDSLGHNIGDQLLQAVGARIEACVRDSDTVARLGGDEFTILLPRLTRSEDVAPIAGKIIDAIRYPFHIEGREFFTTTSIGISVYPDDGSDAETLIKNADTAMYQAKELGRDNYQLFNAKVNAKALQRIALEHGLRKALANDELEVHYQPIVDFGTNRIAGMEALLRWKHPQMGSIPPATFIPIAESTGTMVPIGSWALGQACRQVKKWHDQGFDGLTLAVNLSVTQLQQSDLVNTVRTVLEETKYPPALLELEITESGAMLSPETSIRVLYDLKKLGIGISLDDFGTGHSSLSYLKRFPVDTLKIDQSFVRDTPTDPDAAAIVKAIIAMAHSLRLKVIAEGVENTGQADFLRSHDCDQFQGYLITRPVPADEFIALLR